MLTPYSDREVFPIGYPSVERMIELIEREFEGLDYNESSEALSKYWRKLEGLLGMPRDVFITRACGGMTGAPSVATGVARQAMTPEQQTAEHALCIAEAAHKKTWDWVD